MLQTSLTVFTKNINDMRFDDVRGDGLPGARPMYAPTTVLGSDSK